MLKKRKTFFVVCHNMAVDEVTAIHKFSTEDAARKWVDYDIHNCTTIPFTKQGNPMWDAEDVDRSNPDCIKIADEFEYIITDCPMWTHRKGGVS